MSEQRYLADVRRAFLARGVWGAEARRILEQLADHWQSMAVDLAADGATRADVERRTLAALGRPSMIAAAAAAEIRGRRLLSRHPWLLGGAGTFLGVLFLWAAMIAVTMFASGLLPGQTLETGVFLTNWLPFFAGCLFLLGYASRSPGGWKAIVLASIAVGLAASAFHVSGHPFVNGQGPGSLSADGRTWIVLLLLLAAPFSELIQSALHTDSIASSIANAFDVAACLKLTLPLAAVLLVRQRLRRLSPA